MNPNDDVVTLVEWLVEDRAEVTEGQPVALVETTKSLFEICASVAGRMIQTVSAGQEAAVGASIGAVAPLLEPISEPAGDSHLSLSLRETASFATPTAPRLASRLRQTGDLRLSRRAYAVALALEVDVGLLGLQGLVRAQDLLRALERYAADPNH